MRPGSLLLTWLIIVIPWMARAQEPSTVNRYVVVVGNNQGDAELGKLSYADDDAVLSLRMWQPYAHRVDLLAVLDNDTQGRFPTMARRSTPPTRANLLETLQAVFGDIEKAALDRTVRTELVFIYSGHGGLDDEGKGYLYLSDGPWTRADLFREVLEKSPADFNHLIIDACNAYSLVAGRGDESEAKRIDDFLAGHDLSDYPRAGVLVAQSENRETHEWSRLRAGVFSHQVRSALTGAADVNNDGHVEYSEVAAFVDAAGVQLASLGKRARVFAWAPLRDRRVPLVSLKTGRGLRHVVLTSELGGHFFVEDGKGARLAELHKSVGERVVLALARGEELFLRSAEAEREIADEDITVIAQPPSTPYAVTNRGAADRAFSRGLFAVPFGSTYYRGFVSGRDTLLPVVFTETRFLNETQQEQGRWLVGAGYGLGQSLLWTKNVEHAVTLQVARLLGSRWGVALVLEAGFANSGNENADGVTRLAMVPTLDRQWPLSPRLWARGAIGLGWARLAVTGDAGSADNSVPLGRAELGLLWRVSTRAAFHFGGAGITHRVTIQGNEELRSRLELRTGMTWRID